MDWDWFIPDGGTGLPVCLHEQMEMVGHKAPRDQTAIDENIALDFLFKKFVVARLEKDIPLVVAAVIDVIKTSFHKVHCLHNYSRPKEIISRSEASDTLEVSDAS